MKMKKFFFQNMINRKKLEKETNLYVVEPIVQTTEYWEKIEDLDDIQKSNSLKFDEFKGMELYARLVDGPKQLYWKLYVRNGKKVDIFYVKSADLNPMKIVYKL